jgi:hypothetical protein
MSTLDSLTSAPMELEPAGGGAGRATEPQFIIR